MVALVVNEVFVLTFGLIYGKIERFHKVLHKLAHISFFSPFLIMLAIALITHLPSIENS